MTLDIANEGRYVFYLNFRTEGTDEGLFAEAEQTFTFSNLIENSSNYVISVERFRIPPHTIPMVSATQNFIVMTPKGGQPQVAFDLENTFSFNEFMVQLSTIIPDLIFSLTPDGRMQINFNGFSDYFIRFAPNAAAIFDMANTIGFNQVGTQTFIGGTPLMDRFDQLHKFQIEAQTGLSSVQQEVITTRVFRNLLTDFLVPGTWTMTYNGTSGTAHNPAYSVTYPVRQDIEFNDSANRRFIMLKGNSPVQNIKLEVAAIFRDGTRNQVILPPNSVLEIKLAFWKKS